MATSDTWERGGYATHFRGRQPAAPVQAVSGTRGKAANRTTDDDKLAQQVTIGVRAIAENERKVRAALTAAARAGSTTKDTLNRVQELSLATTMIVREASAALGEMERAGGDVATHRAQLAAAVRSFEETTRSAQRGHSRHTFTGSGDDDNNGNEASDQQQLLQQQHRHTDLDDAVAVNLALIREREEGMAALEQQMRDINEIFRELAQLIGDQGAALDSIEAAMVATAQHTEKGREEVQRAAGYQKKARTKMMWLLGIEAAVAAVLTTVLVVKLK
jgi:chromosome segregation ATPase